MEINNSFEVPLPPDDAWRVLMDIPRIAPCMPGAELTGVLDSDTYAGKVSVRLGPVALAFAGQVKFESVDNAGHKARVKAQGKDTKGRGGANANVDFHLEPSAGGSRVHVKTDLLLSGAVAQYGRASGVIQEVASQLIGEFATCLKRQLEAARAAAATPVSPELDPSVEMVSEAPVIAATTPDAPAAPAAPMASPAVRPISGFRLLGKVLWNLLRGLFGKKS